MLLLTVHEIRRARHHWSGRSCWSDSSPRGRKCHGSRALHAHPLKDQWFLTLLSGSLSGRRGEERRRRKRRRVRHENRS